MTDAYFFSAEMVLQTFQGLDGDRNSNCRNERDGQDACFGQVETVATFCSVHLSS